MKFLNLAILASACLMAPSFAIKETVKCTRGGELVGTKIGESSWTFHSPQSSERVNNADHCNVYEVACEGQCQTEIIPAKWVDPNLPF